MFRFRKWYVDCLGPRNEFVFAYVADVRCAGWHLRSLTVHMAKPGSGALITRSFPISADTIEMFSTDGSRAGRLESSALEFRSADSDIALRWHNEPRFEPVIIARHPNAQILWKTLALPGVVSGRVNFAGHQLEVQEAAGYADYVESTCLPPLVPIRGLRWGRISEPDLGIAFIVATDRTGKQSWSRLNVRTRDSRFQSDDVHLSTGDGGAADAEASAGARAYVLSAESDACKARVSVRPEKCVQLGSFIDQQTCRSALLRSFLKCLTRNPRGKKFLGRADLSIEAPGMRFERKQIPCIDELVSL